MTPTETIALMEENKRLQAEVTALRPFKRMWRDHVAILEAFAKPGTLRIAMVMRSAEGHTVERDAVFDLTNLTNSVLGPSIVGSKAVANYHAMRQALGKHESDAQASPITNQDRKA